MKKSRKISLIIITVALFGCFLFLVWVLRRDDPTDLSIADTSGGPAFDVRVGVPWMGRPLGGILPDALVKKLDGTPSELRFDHTSPGARIGSIGQNRVELLAEGWELLIEIDGEGRVSPRTRLVFPLALGGRHLRLSCRPAAPANGYLRTTTRSGSDAIGGRFFVELPTCENAETGKASEWPPAPLILRGSFVSPVK